MGTVSSKRTLHGNHNKWKIAFACSNAFAIGICEKKTDKKWPTFVRAPGHIHTALPQAYSAPEREDGFAPPSSAADSAAEVCPAARPSRGTRQTNGLCAAWWRAIFPGLEHEATRVHAFLSSGMISWWLHRTNPSGVRSECWTENSQCIQVLT